MGRYLSFFWLSEPQLALNAKLDVGRMASANKMQLWSTCAGVRVGRDEGGGVVCGCGTTCLGCSHILVELSVRNGLVV